MGLGTCTASVTGKALISNLCHEPDATFFLNFTTVFHISTKDSILPQSSIHHLYPSICQLEFFLQLVWIYQMKKMFPTTIKVQFFFKIYTYLNRYAQ